MAKLKRLNIFVDETGEYGFIKGSAKYYGVSLVLHEQSDNIDDDIALLNQKLSNLEFDKMIHMGDLVMGHEDFEGMPPALRKKIYLSLFHFSKRVKAKYRTFITEKKITPTSEQLSARNKKLLSEFIVKNLVYFQSFDKLQVYYDGGQAQLSKVIDEVFGEFSTYERCKNFDKKEKKLFQVADMLTYIDKLIYKYDNNRPFSNTEQRFFTLKDIKRIARALKLHRF